MATVDDIIQAANDAYNDAKTYSDKAIAAVDKTSLVVANALGGIVTNFSGDLPNPADVSMGVVDRPVIPAADLSSDVKAAFDYAFSSLNDSVKPQIVAYLQQFFPDIAGAVKTGSDQWIVDAIANGGRTMPVEVENAIWNRARDKEVQDSLRAEQSIIDATAARGFAMLPGSRYDALLNLQQEASGRMATIGRDIAAKSFEIASEGAKFAIQQAIGLRTAFVSALGEFIRSAMIQPNSAADYAKTMLAARSGLYDSAVRLYSASVAEEEMRVKAQQQNRTLDIGALEAWYRSKGVELHATLGAGKAIVDSQVAQADMLGKMAGAAMATRNTMLSASGSSS